MASHSATQLPPAFERTPEEIWRVVHAYVADYALGTHLSIPWRLELPHDQLNEVTSAAALADRMRQTRRDVLSATRVCKSWHDLATPFLHVSLSFSDQASLVALADHLEASRKVRTHGWGWYAREVIILLPTYSEVEATRNSIAHCVARVVRCCLHLQTYVSFAWGMYAEPREVMQALPATLRHLHWVASGPSFGSWLQVLSRASGLRTLGMTTFYAASDANDSMVPPDLAHLHTLLLNGHAPGCEGLLNALMLWELPALTAVSITLPLLPRLSAAVLAFFGRFGAQLRSLAVPGGLGTRANVMDRILQLCPNVVAISFSLNQRYTLNVTPILAHASVTRVGVQSAFEAMAGLRTEYLPRWAETLDHFDSARFPALKRLRLSSIQDCALRQDQGVDGAVISFWRDRIDEAGAKGVILEDALGRPLRIEPLWSVV